MKFVAVVVASLAVPALAQDKPAAEPSAPPPGPAAVTPAPTAPAAAPAAEPTPATPPAAAPNEPAPTQAAPETAPPPADAAPSQDAPAAEKSEGAAPDTVIIEAAPAQAEQPVILQLPPGHKPAPKREGLYFGLGLAAGMSTLSPQTFFARSALLLSARAGWAVQDWLLVGGTAVWTSQYNSSAEGGHIGSMMSSLMGEVTAFPDPNLPVGVSAGLGWGSGLSVQRVGVVEVGETSIDAGEVAQGGNGLSWMAALGWDFAKADAATFGVQARYDGARLGGELDQTVHGGSVHLWLNLY